MKTGLEEFREKLPINEIRRLIDGFLDVNHIDAIDYQKRYREKIVKTINKIKFKELMHELLSPNTFLHCHFLVHRKSNINVLDQFIDYCHPNVDRIPELERID